MGKGKPRVGSSITTCPYCRVTVIVEALVINGIRTPNREQIEYGGRIRWAHKVC